MVLKEICLLSVLCGARAASIIPTSTGCTDLRNIYDDTGATKIINATEVPSGGLNISSDDGTDNIQNEIPLCHVQGTTKYSEGRSGHVQPNANGNATLFWDAFLPEHDAYNGRYVGIGNGGYAGIIDNSTMLSCLNQGYAVAGCDSGHHINENGNETGYAPFMDDIAKVKAWIHDSIALTTKVARDTVASTYYSQPPDYSYYYGCSTGGGQAYSLAEFYPELFDGVFADGPGNYYTHLMLSFLWNQQHTQGDAFLDQDILDFMTEKVLDACDTIDGVEDKVIENPLHCDFNIETLSCAPGQNSTSDSPCLTPPQLRAAQAIYSGPKDAIGNQIYPGFNFGTESAWLSQEGSLFNSYGVPILRQLVFNNKTYDAAVNKLASPLIDGINTNLSSFHARGGKLITAQGWADTINAATWPMKHLEDIKGTMGTDTVSQFMRLFMVPGGGHCGANPDYPQVPVNYQKNVLDALVEWVESGIPPDGSILSERPSDGSDVTRRLYPWPKEAVFLGEDQDAWESYECMQVAHG
ncbi:tannase and feruloyl esterase-domain-containing protein [Aspergillus stella-maris]|uniref:tannase and feruloyl esterase-domain-containing protein n=1 Tax=Aspergillus stella-maris TaxID=1810926 RepID=UPI003CCD332F